MRSRRRDHPKGGVAVPAPVHIAVADDAAILPVIVALTVVVTGLVAVTDAVALALFAVSGSCPPVLLLQCVPMLEQTGRSVQFLTKATILRKANVVRAVHGGVAGREDRHDLQRPASVGVYALGPVSVRPQGVRLHIPVSKCVVRHQFLEPDERHWHGPLPCKKRVEEFAEQNTGRCARMHLAHLSDQNGVVDAAEKPQDVGVQRSLSGPVLDSAKSECKVADVWDEGEDSLCHSRAIDAPESGVRV